MMMRTLVLTLVFLTVFPAVAERWPPKAFKCLFTSGMSAEDNGSGLSPDSVGPMAFTLASINVKAKTAQMVGNIGAETVTVISGGKGLHFLDITGTGNLVVTTVFSATDSSGKFLAVHSRHIYLAGGPIVSQYYGNCEGLW